MTTSKSEYVSLKELVNSAGYILVVKKAAPFKTIESIKVKNKGKKIPPYTYSVFHFEVLEELFNENQASLQNQKIEAVWSNLGLSIEMHKNNHSNLPVISPIINRYDTKANFFNSEKLIVFLIPSDIKKFAFVIDGAYESIDKKTEILKILKK